MHNLLLKRKANPQNVSLKPFCEIALQGNDDMLDINGNVSSSNYTSGPIVYEQSGIKKYPLCAKVAGATYRRYAIDSDLIKKPFSFACWVKFDNITVGVMINTLYRRFAAGHIIGLFAHNSRNNGEITVSHGSYEPESNIRIVPNTWYFIVFTMDNTTDNLFINSNCVMSDNYTTISNINPNTNTPYMFLFAHNEGGYKMSGSLTGFRIYDKALTKNEIESIYKNEK